MHVIPQLQVIDAHKGSVWSICAAHSGLIVTGSGDGLLKSWKVEAHTGKLLPLAEVVTPHTEVLLIRQSSHGVLISAGHEGGIVVWELDPDSGGLTQRQQLMLSDERRHYNDRLLETDSGYLLAWASGTVGHPSLCQWSEPERAFVFLQELPIEHASTFLELPDGVLLSGDEAGQLRCWRCEGGAGAWSGAGALQAHESSIRSLFWTRQGTLISAGGPEPLLKVWRGDEGCENWRLEQVLVGHQSQILEAMESGSGELLSADRGERSLLGWRRRPEMLVWNMALGGWRLVQRQMGRLRGCFEGGLILEGDGESAFSLWRRGEEVYERIAVLDGGKSEGVSTFTLLARGTLVSGGLDGRLISWDLGSFSHQRVEAKTS